MESDLHNALRSFCLNPTWKFSIFWKLHSRTALTFEDAYYDSCMLQDSMGRVDVGNSVGDRSQNHSPGFPVAKMPYHVYSLGEGVVGQVAATGHHRWIYAENVMRNPLQSLEALSDGLLELFAAGIKTILVVAVLPFGVVQLGSLNKVVEDIKFIYLVRDAILSLLYSSYGPTLTNSFLPGLGNDVPNKFGKQVSLVPDFSEKDKVSKVNHNAHHMEEQKHRISQQSYDSEAMKSCCIPNSVQKLELEVAYGSDYTSRANDTTYMLEESECSKNLGKQTEFGGQSNQVLEHESLAMFSAGYELHEALGPDFMKRYVLGSEHRNSDLTADAASKSLLEAVVSNACHSGSDVVSEKSVCKSVKPLLIAEKQPESSCENKAKISGAGHSLNACVKEDMQEWSNSTEVCGKSTCFSAFSERGDKSEPVKKRARPGESCRQRPRDRQLIQDRIKELRELVPNGSKCSIDSLLERTIKHMLFLESITKHAEKLNKCTESKMQQKGTASRNYEHGSSWAVEVGGHFNVSSVVVENVNRSGQLLVEMLCDECSHFLEIAEAIRGLGLSILKGVTESQGDKTWICFVVEGQNNQGMHRMDVLWSLVQALQPKASM